MAMIDEMTKDEKLLVQAALDVEFEQSTGSGHNTAWGESIDLVLEGRKGLFDYSDKELDDKLAPVLLDPAFGNFNKESLLAWARDSSGIQSVSSTSRTWETVKKDEIEIMNDMILRGEE